LQLLCAVPGSNGGGRYRAAHLVREEGVAGSNPATPTNLFPLTKSDSPEESGRGSVGHRDSYRDRNGSPMGGGPPPAPTLAFRRRRIGQAHETKFFDAPMAKIDDILIFCCLSGFFAGLVVAVATAATPIAVRRGPVRGHGGPGGSASSSLSNSISSFEDGQ
jgi:hypothetical protein